MLWVHNLQKIVSSKHAKKRELKKMYIKMIFYEVLQHDNTKCVHRMQKTKRHTSYCKTIS